MSEEKTKPERSVLEKYLSIVSAIILIEIIVSFFSFVQFTFVSTNEIVKVSLSSLFFNNQIFKDTSHQMNIGVCWPALVSWISVLAGLFCLVLADIKKTSRNMKIVSLIGGAILLIAGGVLEFMLPNLLPSTCSKELAESIKQGIVKVSYLPTLYISASLCVVNGLLVGGGLYFILRKNNPVTE